ncbi:uncharacterized protein FPRO_11575 [Fusarium proliferatum ET1]|uniref:Uncharacterized protein n=1 Tax=Fusarium proliferatum (strain ET1) TaxID=1227346 RepID=A0A1L7W0E6_FUSPR|nr:uncharacterized protein FPRO_11575 [Fusarium proliferatum ET1]CZR46128.1 uncharacterized protein FPRO_11575 [Fusarium proliferatum ET1]
MQCDSTSLDCLIVLIRHIQLHMHQHYPSPDHSAMEARNPILFLAWFDFDRDVTVAWIEVKQNIWKPLGPASSDDPKLQFENLCNCDLVWEASWGRGEFKLLRAILDKAAGEPWDIRPQVAEQMSTNVLPFDPRERSDVSFNEYISTFLKQRQATDGSQTMNLCARPNIMQVKYTRRKEFTPVIRGKRKAVTL